MGQQWIITLFPIRGQKLEDVAKIIDGQHRIEGLKNFNGEKPFEINVSIFVGSDIATQANIFATVNLAQTKVNRSLAYDLLSYESTRSPQKTCHDIAIALDRYEKSPFKGRIKRLGTATPGRKQKEVLTQAAIVESIVGYISSAPSKDRNTFLQRMFPKKAAKDEQTKLIFRNMWLEEKDTEITKIIINYFTAVQNKWPVAWDDLERKGNVLPKTNGFKALMRFLRVVYLDFVGEKIGAVPTVDNFSRYFDRVKMTDDKFNTDTFKPGTSGEALLLRILMKSMPD